MCHGVCVLSKCNFAMRLSVETSLSKRGAGKRGTDSKWEWVDWFARQMHTHCLHFMLELILMNVLEVKQQLQLFMWTIYVITTNKQSNKTIWKTERKWTWRRRNKFIMYMVNKYNILPINLCWRWTQRVEWPASGQSFRPGLLYSAATAEVIKSKLKNICVCCAVLCMQSLADAHICTWFLIKWPATPVPNKCEWNGCDFFIWMRRGGMKIAKDKSIQGDKRCERQKLRDRKSETE